MEQIRKDWSEIKSNDSWSIFKIMSEFVEAFDRLSKIGPCVSIFGSARTSVDNKYYLLGVQINNYLRLNPNLFRQWPSRWNLYSLKPNLA